MGNAFLGIYPERRDPAISFQSGNLLQKMLSPIKVCVLLLMDSSDCVLYCLKINLFAYLGSYMAKYG